MQAHRRTSALSSLCNRTRSSEIPRRNLRARTYLEFVEEIRDVAFDRALAENQLFGDLAVGKAVSHEAGDLALTSSGDSETPVA